MRPSLSLILTVIFFAYIGHSIYSLVQIFRTLSCTSEPCFTSYLATGPKLQLLLFTSPTASPISAEATKILTVHDFDYHSPLLRHLDVELPAKTRRNGTLFLHVVVAEDKGEFQWKDIQRRDGPTVIRRIALTEFAVPRAATFNLLGEKGGDAPKGPLSTSARPVAHFQTKIFTTMLTDNVSMSQADIPPELARLVKVSYRREFLPIVQNDFLKTRMTDLEEITRNSSKMSLEFNYAPISIGKLRLILHVEHAMASLTQMGFSKKDVDEVKGIFSDTNVYLLAGTVLICSIHLLFDFLSFKNDVIFWKRKRNYAGLSVRTTLWRAFSTIVVFLYLLDENTSLLVLIPAGIGTLIELWKSKKILKLDFSLSTGLKWRKPDEKQSEAARKAEQYTREVDKEGMRYLSYLLYPLCIGGAVYSLVYQPHKSWYSWTINSLVNGVYAFGFLFMLPQLFINYKLKSVAALPWRAFMYKAFNTFIDDLFSFLIVMPTAHRVACFRDDIVFLIYMYQRWLYPVDKSRVDEAVSMTGEDEVELLEPPQAADEKKKN